MDRRSFARNIATLSITSGALAAGAASAHSSSDSCAAAFSRAATFTAVGKEERPFIQAAEGVLAEHSGHGFLDHMWFGGSFSNYLRLRLRVYVDYEELPAIDMELGMGIGVGFADPSSPWGTKFSGITGAPSGVYCNYRIPFSKHIRVTAELPPGVPQDTVFWWIVRGVEGLPLNLSGMTLPACTRLKLYKNVARTVQPLEEFDLCKVSGAGMIFQVAIAAKSANFEYLEGQMRAYLGKNPKPQFLSSGLEDYFLGTYYFNRGTYHLPQAGLTHKDNRDSSFSAYRFHDIDPVFFDNGIRLACRCGEKSGDKVFGPTGKPQSTTYTTYTWVYEW